MAEDGPIVVCDDDRSRPESAVFDRLDPVIETWWRDTFEPFVDENEGYFTPPQRQAIPLIDDRKNTVIAAPTGSGKTLASFTAILNELLTTARSNDGLENAVYCLYISPLKSLANDIHRNLERPLEGMAEIMNERGETPVSIRHAIRHGDTSSTERNRMLETTPHILNTTPETLAILLNSPKFREKLRSVEYVIVDEIHALADNKRGTHLAVSLERLASISSTSITRVGCSATIDPLDRIARFLVGKRRADGPYRDCTIVDARFERSYDIKLECPVEDLIHTARDRLQSRFYERLDEHIHEHTNTIVFTNTRAGAERVLYNLRERFDHYSEENSACHHGSLSQEVRQDVERRLKGGELSVVTTSTSLELGIDMPYVDHVVQVGSPKSVAALLQRIGRAGHRVGQTVSGCIIALDRDDLVESAVMVKKAEEGFVDSISIPENAQDVAAQHVYGMAIASVRAEASVLDTLRRAYPYRSYSEEMFDTLLRYLTAEYTGMNERNVYAKIWRDGNDPPDGRHHYPEFDVNEPLIGRRGRLARVIYLTNVGTIPDSFSCSVHLRGGDSWLGQLDEAYLDSLSPGDVFVLGGDRFEYRYRRGSKLYVDRSDARPTVPSWFSERLPLSVDLGREISRFQRDLLDRYRESGSVGVRAWLRQYPMDDHSVRALSRLYEHQIEYAGETSVSTPTSMAIEIERDRDAYRRRYYVHTTLGRRVNDGLSRLLAAECARHATTNVTVSVADNGFVLSMPMNYKVDLLGIFEDLTDSDVRQRMRSALSDTDLLKRHFRIVATRSLLILKRYKGYEKSASEQQVSSEMLLGYAEALEDFAVMNETYRELLDDKLRIDEIERLLRKIDTGDLELHRVMTDSPSPLSYGLATLSSSDVVLADDESAALQSYHSYVIEEIGEGSVQEAHSR